MPELPDIVLYENALRRLLIGRTLNKIIVRSPFVLRTFEPTVDQLHGRQLADVFRMEKRIVWRFSGDLFIVFHLMIAGRFHWRAANRLPNQKIDLAAFQFEHGTLMYTEASQKKRASMHVAARIGDVESHRRGGLEVLSSTLEEFEHRLCQKNRTLKRALTDPTNFSGIGNAYSDEILHAARLSPLKRTQSLKAEEISRLHLAAIATLELWIERLNEEHGDAFPEKVRAMKPEMNVHGKFKESCSVCKASIARIVYAENECNYCPGCQTGGKLLADRSLSRLLKDEWPKNISELD